MKLSNEEINNKLKGLNGWRLDVNLIKKTFEFDNFLESIEFVNKIAPIAEEMNHHPDINISYNKVTVNLSTHDENGVTERDISLAGKINFLI